MVERYEVVVAGAGVAGASAAYFISRKGFKVLLVDVKPYARAGDKPCGDAIGKHHFDELGMEYPGREELEGLVKAVDVYSPSEGARYRVLGEGFEVDRVRFTQRLIRGAVDRGAEYLDGAQVSRPIVRGGSVVGAVLWRRGRGFWEVYSDVVIDATGICRAVVSKLPKGWPISEALNPRDTNIAYREVRVLREPIDEPEVLRIYISKKVAPGGYWWLFPYSLREGYVNVGLGVQGGVGNPNPKTLLRRYVVSRPELRGSTVVEAGGAAIPTRRPANTLVWNGVAVVGDAAFTVNPLHGGGKGSAMLSSYCVSEAVAEALGERGATASELWYANTCYIRRYGAKQAVLDLFRLFLQGLSDDDLEFGMSRKIIREDDLNKISLKGDLELSVVDKAMRLLSGIRRPSLLLRLRAVANYMSRVKKLYARYPSGPEGLKEWLLELKGLYNEYFSKVLT